MQTRTPVEWGAVHVRGADARALLQGQLSQDVARARGDHAPLAAWCNPKGRAIAVVRVLADGEHDLQLVLPATEVDLVSRRLGMYVLRANARVEADTRAWRHAVVARDHAAALAARHGLQLPDAPGACRAAGELRLVGLHNDDVLLCAPADVVDADTPAADSDRRRLLAGLPSVHEATREAFVPLMLNLDVLDGISFSKGCYIGQEIIARTRNLGRIKRRMLLLEGAGAAALTAGDAVYTEEGESAGQVVEAHDDVLLAVVPLVHAQAPLYADSGATRALAMRTLPYAVPELASAA